MYSTSKLDELFQILNSIEKDLNLKGLELHWSNTTIATGVCTMVHLKNNKIWSTLQEVLFLHSDLVEHCQKHLVYLGFRIFLHLKIRPPVNPDTLPILGTVLSDDPVTQKELLLSIGKKIKPN